MKTIVLGILWVSISMKFPSNKSKSGTRSQRQGGPCAAYQIIPSNRFWMTRCDWVTTINSVTWVHANWNGKNTKRHKTPQCHWTGTRPPASQEAQQAGTYEGGGGATQTGKVWRERGAGSRRGKKQQVCRIFEAWMWNLMGIFKKQ